MDGITIIVALVATHYAAFLAGQWLILARWEKSLQGLREPAPGREVPGSTVLDLPSSPPGREIRSPESEARRNQVPDQ